MAPRVLLTLAVSLTVLLSARPAAAADERYHGRVVDAETTQPLEGAVVTVIWMKSSIVSMDGVGTFHDAREAKSDIEGRFSVEATPARNFNPFRSVQRQPQIIVYKPGYGRYPDAYSRLSWPNPPPIESVHDTLHARRAVTIELPRLTTRQELELFADASLHPDVPYERVPIYLTLINEARVRLNFAPLSVPKVHRPQGDK